MARATEKITVVNPRSQLPSLEFSPMAPRFKSLDGKKVYIVGLTWPYTFQFNEEMYKVLSERFPKTTFILRKKYGAYAEDDPKLWAEIQEQGAGAILGVGH
jgi:hypothetical protein